MKTNQLQKNIPQGWRSTKIGDLGSAYSGLRSKSKNDFGNGSPYITYMNVFSNSKIDKDRFELVEVTEKENQNKVKYGDVFFTISSETPEEVGMSSVLLDEIDNYYLNSFCFGFRLNDFNSLLPQYARFLFRGPDFRFKIVKMAQGSTRFNLSKERVLSLEMLLPSIKEQEKLSEILSEVDEDIVKTQEVIGVTEKLKKGLMQQLFTRGIGHTKFKKTKLGEIPEEWDDLIIEDVCVVRQGLQIPISERFKEAGKNRHLYLTIKYLKNAHLPDVAEYIENPLNSVVCKEDDILMTRTGNTGKVITGIKGVFHNNFFLVDYDREKIDKDFFVQYLNSYLIQKMIGVRAGSTTIPDLNHGDFYSLPLWLPQKTEQQRIAEILSAVDEKISINKKLKSKLTQLKKGLTQDLLSGKVRTKDIIG